MAETVKASDMLTREVPITPTPARVRPIVVKGRRKRRYSRRLKGVQKQMRSVTRISDRLLSAVAAGLKLYRARSDKSAVDRRDGMLRDFFKNSARSIEKTVRRSSRMSRDVAKLVSGKALVRRARAMFRYR